MELKDILPALIGLFGALVGGFISIFNSKYPSKRQDDKELKYLVVKVLFHLQKLISTCSYIVNDDGLYNGQRDKNGAKRPQIEIPSFDPTEVNLNWKVLDIKLMYEILSIPADIELYKATEYAAYDYGDGGPDFNDVFEARKINFSKLGLKSIKISDELKNLVGLQDVSVADGSLKKIFQDAITNTEEKQHQRYIEQKRILDNMKSSQ